jgi:iron complex outermembrane receptor protein
MMKISRKTITASTALVLSVALPGMAGATDVANEYFQLDITQLMNITVTSVAKRDQRLADAPAAVFVITQEDIRRAGITRLPEALAMAPGLQVSQISASKWSVASRGFAGYTSNKLLVMIDGRSVYSPAFSGVFWDAQSTLLEDIRGHPWSWGYPVGGQCGQWRDQHHHQKSAGYPRRSGASQPRQRRRDVRCRPLRR